MFQDPKYFILAINRQTGRIIPPHVPLMLFTARDSVALPNAIAPYASGCFSSGASEQQIASARERVEVFRDFAADHPDEMKLPGTPSVTLEPLDFPVSIDGHYTYWLSGGNVVQFVKPTAEGVMPGTTNEEVLNMLIDRVTAQDAAVPHKMNVEMLTHLKCALAAQRARTHDMATQAPPAPAVGVKFGIAMHAIEKSSNLEAHGYCTGTQRMALQYRGGRIYHYKQVPQNVYDAFLAAESKGSYAAREIQGKYDSEPMGVVPA